MAQIELASADAPFVAYKKHEKTKEEKLKGYTPEKARRDVERWKERQKTRKISLESFIGGARSSVTGNGAVEE